MQGYFISFEGGEGSGKTTVLSEVERALISQGYKVCVTREPGGIPISEKVREVILNPGHTEMDERTEALLYAAARRQHLVEKIIPAYQAGSIVLCDRFIDSSLAYQGYARGIGLEEVAQINAFAIDDFYPSLTLFFDLAPEKGLERIALNEGREKNRLDLEAIEFHHKVYEGYQILLAQNKKRIKRINADATVEQVTEKVLSQIYKHLK